MHAMRHAETRPHAAQGAQVYGHRLARIGGNQLEFLARGIDRTAIVVSLYDAPPYDLVVPPLPVARLSLNLLPGQVSGGIAGERGASYTAPRHSLYLTPAGAEVRWRKPTPSRHVNIYFHADAFSGGDARGLVDTPLFNARLPGLRPLADELAGELMRSDAMAAEAVDSLARLMLVRVARAAGQSAGLSKAALTRVREHVHAHLAERLMVADLAAVAGLAPNRYATEHLRLTGQPVHQWVLGLRLARAMEMLEHSPAGLAAIAADCGFSSQQHLTHAMSARMGITPARYRAQRRR